jgi:hypothetical protein
MGVDNIGVGTPKKRVSVFGPLSFGAFHREFRNFSIQPRNRSREFIPLGHASELIANQKVLGIYLLLFARREMGQVVA